MTLELVEWHNVTGKTYAASGNTFSFDPFPRSVKKDIAVKWRIRRPGYEKKLERARFRYNEKITFTISGACKLTKRDELEFFSKRDSLFKITGLDLKTHHAEYSPDVPESDPANFAASSVEDVYVVFEKANFTQTEGKTNWIEYQITLRRVHPTRH